MNKTEAKKHLDTLVDLKSMAKNEARVAIAKDVLAALALKKIATGGVYFHADVQGSERFMGSVSLRDQLPKIEQCEVCALGGLFVALVARENEFNVDVNYGTIGVFGIQVYKHLRSYFTTEQLSCIESWFECHSSDVLDIPKAWVWLEDTERMKRIMENIVDNDGTFQPSQLDV